MGVQANLAQSLSTARVIKAVHQSNFNPNIHTSFLYMPWQVCRKCSDNGTVFIYEMDYVYLRIQLLYTVYAIRTSVCTLTLWIYFDMSTVKRMLARGTVTGVNSHKDKDKIKSYSAYFNFVREP